MLFTWKLVIVGTDGSLHCCMNEVPPGFRLSWDSIPPFPVFVLMERDGVEYSVPPDPLKGDPLN